MRPMTSAPVSPTAVPGRRTGSRPRRSPGAALAALLLVFVGWAAVTGDAAAAGRVALVVGNGEYEHVSRLDNPVNDAVAMRDALNRLGFDVVFRRDADEDAMGDALDEFERRSAGADVALVFYAGHGLEMNGVNYLVPVDARLASAAAVNRETILLDDVLTAAAAATTRVVILDACRDNPWVRSMRGATRGNVSAGGLAAVATGAGSLVAYAAAAGDVAEDGEGQRHSPFTEALLARIETPGVDVRIMLGDVGAAVRARTGRQQPFVYSSLSGELHLNGGAAGPGPAAVEAGLGLDRAAWRTVQRGLAGAGFASGAADGVAGPATRAAIRAWQTARGAAPTGYLDAASLPALGVAAPAPSTASTAPVETGGGSPAGAAASASAAAAALQAETALWQSIESRPTLAKYEAYLSQYPNGTFAALARLEAAALRADPPGASGRPPSRPASASDPRPSRRAGERFRDCAECPELVVAPAGSFTMGSPLSEEGRFEDEGPQRRVTIPSPLAVGVYEVTFAEWDACVSAGGCGGHRPDDRGWGRGSRPVINVSWEDARAYVDWLSRRTGASYRLLSESEWEYVARGGSRTAYWWGGSVGRNRANCFDCGSRWDGEQTAPVGSFGANGFGLHDVSGNVWEWVEDCWHADYRGAPADGSAWTSGGNCGLRVLRGGSWSNGPRILRSASRNGNSAGSRVDDSGFRVSRTLE